MLKFVGNLGSDYLDFLGIGSSYEKLFEFVREIGGPGRDEEVTDYED